MAGWSNELKVGALTLIAVGAGIIAVIRTDDRPISAKGGAYDLYLLVPSAEGVYPSTQVKLAGVSVGSVMEVTLDPERNQARLRLEMNGEVKLPVTSSAELKNDGVLGDRFVRVVPGEGDVFYGEGDTLSTKPATLDMDKLQGQLNEIADDVGAITSSVRTMVEDDGLRAQVNLTADNIEQVSSDLKEITSANREDLRLITENLKLLSTTLNTLVAHTGDSVAEEMAALKVATAKLDETLGHVNQITERVNAGEGTIGKLLTDTSTIDQVNHTLAQVGEVVDSISGLHTEVYYRGDYFVGTDPNEPDLGFTDNPLAGSSRSVIGLKLMPKEDYWYVFEIVDHPIGDITYEEHVLSDTGTSWTEYVRTPNLRYTLQFARRWQNAVVRFGLKEGGGGIGVDWMLAHDKLSLSADLYDFGFASWPILDGTPNLSLAARGHPYKHIYLEAGAENAIFGLRHGYVTGFVGGGFYFTDDDFKWVLATLPFPG